MSADAVLLALGGLIQGVMLVAVVGLGWSAWHLGWPEEGDLQQYERTNQEGDR